MTDGVLSSYVYIDQKDTTRNVIYVSDALDTDHGFQYYYLRYI